MHIYCWRFTIIGDGHDRPGQTRADKGRPGQTRTDQEGPGKTRADQDTPRQTRGDQGRAELPDLPGYT